MDPFTFMSSASPCVDNTGQSSDGHHLETVATISESGTSYLNTERHQTPYGSTSALLPHSSGDYQTFQLRDENLSSSSDHHGDLQAISSVTPSYGSSDNNWRKDSWEEEEVLEDITTWSTDTMRAAAASLQASTDDDQWHPTMPSGLAFGNSAESGRALLQPVLGRQRISYVQSGSSSTKSQRGRKLKLYQLPRQEDKELEIRRLRAVKEHEYREEQERKERQLKIKLRELESQIANLQIEKVNLQANINKLENENSRLESEGDSDQRDCAQSSEYSFGWFQS